MTLINSTKYFITKEKTLDIVNLQLYQIKFDRITEKNSLQQKLEVL